MLVKFATPIFTYRSHSIGQVGAINDEVVAIGVGEGFVGVLIVPGGG